MVWGTGIRTVGFQSGHLVTPFSSSPTNEVTLVGSRIWARLELRRCVEGGYAICRQIVVRRRIQSYRNTKGGAVIRVSSVLSDCGIQASGWVVWGNPGVPAQLHNADKSIGECGELPSQSASNAGDR